jgi:YD repeat-containing protein
VQNTIGLTTTVHLPDGQVIGFEYDPARRLIGVQLNGQPVAARARPSTALEGTGVALLRNQLQRLVEALLKPAYAQGLPLAPGPGVVSPRMALPGQPSTAPALILAGEDRPGTGGTPLPPFDARADHIRWLAEKLADFCRCDPAGGFERPKLTASAYVHIVMGGHASPAFSNQSYFTEPVNQALVDEVVSRATWSDAGSRRVYVVADMGRQVGFSRRADGTFAPARGVRLVVQQNNCDSFFRVRNEVITMYPAK